MAPIYDATMGDTDAVFDLLAAHLRQLDSSRAETVVFCADGARRLKILGIFSGTTFFSSKKVDT